jgi:hypothetical protein
VNGHEIAPIICPGCGSTSTGPARPLAFGAEFSCRNCGGTFVLIINRALIPVDLLDKSGDQICAMCGRVENRDARFCQDGHKLVRQCINRDCRKEFPAGHQRCDRCGWPQDVIPGTAQYAELEVDRAIRDLADADSSVYAVVAALRKIQSAGTAGTKAVPSILDGLRDKRWAGLYCSEESIEEDCWRVFAAMGPAASGAVPLLRKRIDEVWTTNRGMRELWIEALATISPPDVLPLCKRSLDECVSPKVGGLGYLEAALTAARIVGEAAVPTLQEFCNFSFFGSDSSKALRQAARDVVKEIGANGRFVVAWSISGRSSGEWIKG